MNPKYLTNLPLPLRDGALFIDNSFLEDVQTCSRLSEYRQVRRRVPSGQKPSLSFGGAGHLVLEHRYRNYGVDLNDVLDRSKCEQEQMDLLVKYFSEHPAQEGDWRDLNWAIEVFVKQYNSRYQVEPFNLLAGPDGKPLIEQSFAIPFLAYNQQAGSLRRIDNLEELHDGDVPIIYMGRIDLPVSWDGLIFIGDHKTSSVLGDSVYDDIRISPQMLGYAWAYLKTTGTLPMGFFVNFIRVKPMPAKPREGIAKWWEENFQRMKEYIDLGRIEEWEVNTHALIDEFLWHHRRGYFPMKRKWCSGKYGRCAFYEVCYSPFEQRQVELDSQLYQENIWTPLNKDLAAPAAADARAVSPANGTEGPAHNVPPQVEPPVTSSGSENHP